MMDVESCEQYDAAVALFKLLHKLGIKSAADAADVCEGEYSYDFKRKECCEMPGAECYCNHDDYPVYDDYYEDDFAKPSETTPDKGEPDGHEPV